MLTPEQITAFQDSAQRITEPVTEYLIAEIAKRIAAAGKITSTAAYQIWRAQQLGLSLQEIQKKLQKLLAASRTQVDALLSQAGELGYNFDVGAMQAAAVPFAENESIQQIVRAAVAMAGESLVNATQTLGFVNNDGVARPLTQALQKACDFAFYQVSTGAEGYDTAIRKATRELAAKDIRSIDYESGVHTSLEAAVRRNVMGALGLMQERISQENHDILGANGWEISAHAASAPDHEPFQGRQYSDEAYKALNNSLVRRIGTLNCGHAAFPIILGVNKPQYTEEELEKLRQDNAAGIDYQGRHYSMYEATQMQRKLERAIRKQKRRILVDEGTEDKDKLLTDRIRLVRLQDEYGRFSKAAGLCTQLQRADVVGFDWKKAKAARKAHDTVDNAGKSGTINAKDVKNMTIQSIERPVEMPIEQRHTGKGNPNAVLTFGIELNNRQKCLLENLPEFDSRVVISKKAVNMADLSALTAYTGHEFAMFTKGHERLIIRGNSYSVNINVENAKQLSADGYKWSGHTHPGVDFNCLLPSGGDKGILQCFKQDTSVIYNSKGQFVTFEKG